MRRFIALALTLSALAACTSPLVRTPENGQAGVFVLALIDGTALPHLDGPGSAIARREVSEGLLQLRADGTFYLDLTYYVSTGAGTRRSDRFHEGMWTRVGDVIDFEFDNGAVERARISDGRIILPFDGATYTWAP